ncbi:MAG: hypothetical protein JSR17_06945 [Proteobacteria bacterium]|nr:hypothetical protein [Pseudomonadota bacterium]
MKNGPLIIKTVSTAAAGASVLYAWKIAPQTQPTESKISREMMVLPPPGSNDRPWKKYGIL